MNTGFLLTIGLVFLQLPKVSRASTSDFIIVGGGTSGCVLAARLCVAFPDASISVLERGKPLNESARFVKDAMRNVIDAWVDPQISESFLSLPNDGLSGRRVLLTTGAVLGGSSSSNAVQFVVPLEGYVRSLGIAGLSPMRAKRLYRRVYRKVGFRPQPPLVKLRYADDYLEAGRNAGFEIEDDPFRNNARLAMWNTRSSIDGGGRRVDSCAAYLNENVRDRCSANLRVVQGVTVIRVLFSRTGLSVRATGVEYVSSDDKQLQDRKVMLARKEVLLSAGPYGSPKLLQLSGIGPREVLDRVGLKTVRNLPVGVSTQSRAASGHFSAYTGVPLEPANNSTVLNSTDARQQWENGLGGVYGSSPFPMNGVVKDICYLTNVLAFGGLLEGLDEPLLASFCLGNPTSRGYICLNDSNPFSSPLVQLDLLGNREDLLRIQRCLRLVQKVHRSFPPQFKLTDLSQTSADEEEIRNTALTPFHYVGGCAVGSVVRSDLRVRGVYGLRIVDASVLRHIPTSAGPLSTTYVVAEHAAGDLIRRYRCRFGRCRRRVWWLRFGHWLLGHSSL